MAAVYPWRPLRASVVPLAEAKAGKPGAYAWLGQTPGAALHNAGYNFDDEIIPLGAALLARIVERRSAASAAA